MRRAVLALLAALAFSVPLSGSSVEAGVVYGCRWDHDMRGAGVYCTSGSPNVRYRAVVHCTSPHSTYYGPWVRVPYRSAVSCAARGKIVHGLHYFLQKT